MDYADWGTEWKDHDEMINLRQRLKEAEELIFKLAAEVHPYLIHEHRDTLEQRFGEAIDMTRMYQQKYKD